MLQVLGWLFVLAVNCAVIYFMVKVFMIVFHTEVPRKAKVKK